MSYTTLGVDVVDGIARIQLTRPEKRNALNRAMVEELLHALDGLRRREDVRVVSIRGEGKDFCAGADLAEVAETQEMGPEAGLRDAERLGELFVAMRRHPRPIVAVVTGRAIAGGSGLASACDVVLAHEDAEFGYPEVHLGFVPAMVMTILRRKMGETAAFDLVARGRRIGAAEARRIGLVTEVISGEMFAPAVHEYLAELASRPPTAVSLTKRLLYGLDHVSFEDGIARGVELNTLARGTSECREGVRRFLKKD